VEVDDKPESRRWRLLPGEENANRAGVRVNERQVEELL
jgi:hypothetical protein